MADFPILRLPDGVRRLFRLPFRTFRRITRDVDDEVAFHLESRAGELIAAGMSPEDARAEANRRFGDADDLRNFCRSLEQPVIARARLREWLTDLGQDARLAIRSLRRSPAFTLTIVGMLGLGMGAAAAMYGILDRLLLRSPAHVRDADHLYAVYVTHATSTGPDVTRGSFSWNEAQVLAQGNEAVSAFALYGDPSSTQATIEGQSVPLQEVMTSVEYFGVLGVHPFVGRFFGTEDTAAGAPPVAVIGNGFWRRELGAAGSALGRTIQIGGHVYTVVGVAPRGFSGVGPDRVDAWLPADHAVDMGPRTFGYGWHVVARVRTVPQQAASAALLRLENAPPDARAARYKYKDVKLTSTIPGRAPAGPTTPVRLTFLVSGAATLMALVALANAVGLLLLRALRRTRETAIRLALGVSRGRLLRAAMVESVLLALAAGAVASLLAAAGGEVLRRLLLRTDWAMPVVDLRVVAATIATSVFVGSVCGFVPGWLGGRPATIATLKSGGHDGAFHRAGAPAALLVIQGALSIALVTGLALFSRSFQRARAFDFGPEVDHLLLADLRDRPSGTLALISVPPGVASEAMERVAALRGVQAVAAVSAAPLSMFAVTELRAEGVDSMPRGRPPTIVAASPNYFAASGLSVVRGRQFLDQGPGGPKESVVSDDMARALWPRGDAIGRCLYIGHAVGPAAPACVKVVGVVKDLHPWLTRPDPILTYYVPLSQTVTGMDARTLVVRTERPARLVSAVRQIVASVAGVRSPDAVRTLRDVVDPQYRQLRQGMALFGIFSALAAIVAMIGMYSVVAYSVTQRAHEFGVRVALGARAHNLARLVLKQALGYAGAGLVAGLVLSLLGARYIAPLLYQTSPHDPLALLVAALALVVAALVACVIPARAAARADPRQALQAE